MASANVHEFTNENWAAEVARSEVPVVVDFWAPWCGPCRTLSPIVDRVADQFAGKVKVGKVNVDENPELASQYRVTNIPRLLFFKGGETPVQTVVGVVQESELVRHVNALTAG